MKSLPKKGLFLVFANVYLYFIKQKKHIQFNKIRYEKNSVL